MLRFITPGSFRLVRARLVIAGLGLVMIGSAGLSALGTEAAYASTAGYKVVSTSGLNERTAPSTASGVVGTLANGTTLDIACQAGGVLYATGGSPSSDDIWDQLTNGRFVADYWVNTPGRGAFSPGIPRCGLGAEEVGTVGPRLDTFERGLPASRAARGPARSPGSRQTRSSVDGEYGFVGCEYRVGGSPVGGRSSTRSHLSVVGASPGVVQRY